MAEAASHTWGCAQCGRRVPTRVTVCHCGATRAQAEAVRAGPARGAAPLPVQPGWRGVWASLPTDVVLVAAAAGLVLLAGFGFLAFGPPVRNDTPALLGYVDRRPPKPPDTRSQPPFKLPWWK
jgi:hypothetical protein